ncbi:MAG: S26 family signal peptidase [Lentisphaeria bacterium]|nr:S26 family signal peptidase [Lentisphaeria bacterium]
MNILLLVLFDLFVVWFFFGNSLRRWLSPKPLLPLLFLGDTERHFRHLLRRDRDLLATAQREALANTADTLRASRRNRQSKWAFGSGDMAALAAQPMVVPYAKTLKVEGIEAALNELAANLPGGPETRLPKGRRVLREYLEIAVVALGLAFGVRALFLQPFKIPTGSMQPTLYGIHFVHTEDGVPPLGPVGRFFGGLHYSRRYVDYTVREAGELDFRSIRPVRRPIPLQNWLLPATSVRVGNTTYLLPGDNEVVKKYLYTLASDRSRRLGPERAIAFAKGETFLRGYLSLGDHLFVDRTYLPFHEPVRGDVTVFRTDHIRDPEGRSLNGPYYIKRLVGMPGDELRVVNRHIHLRRPGETDFRPLDGGDHPGFDRVYSGLGGYRGHSHAGGFCLTDEDDTLYIPRQGDLLKVEPLTAKFSIRTVDDQDFKPYRPGHLALPIQGKGMRDTLAWLENSGWFEPLGDAVYRFRYDHYLLLGDNTDNSSDGRYWGTIPRANLVGRAGLVWWPFTRRWGWVDRLPPLDYPSPETPFDLPPPGADAGE